MMQINFIIIALPIQMPYQEEKSIGNMKHNVQFFANLPAPFPSWVHRAQPNIPICF